MKKYLINLMVLFILVSAGEYFFPPAGSAGEFPGKKLNSIDRLIYSTSEQPPEWVSKLPAEKGFLYFAGVFTGAATVELAKEAAIHNVAGQIARHIGITVRAKLEQLETEIFKHIITQIKSSSSKGKNAYLQEFYCEKWRGKSAERMGIYYNAYALIRYPIEEIERERDRFRKQRAVRIKESRAYLYSADKNIREGRVMPAFLDYSLSLKVLEGEEDTEHLVNESVSEALETFRNLKLIKFKNDSVGTVKEGLANPLIVEVVYESGEAGIPVRDIPVNFSFISGRGVLDSGVYTGQAGRAECCVSRINTLQARNIVEASINFRYLLKSNVSSVNDIIKGITPVKEKFIFETSGTGEDSRFATVNIAVMPFKNMTGDVSSDWLEHGIMEGISHKLARLDNLRVIEYNKQGVSAEPTEDFLDKLRRRFGVEYVVYGSIGKSKSGLGLRSRVVNINSNKILGTCSGNEFGSVNGILGVQDKIALGIAGILRIFPTKAEKMKMKKTGATNREAYKYFCMGLNYQANEEYEKALKMYRKSIKLDPKYDAPYNNRGVIYYIRRIYGEAVSSYKKAIELNSYNPGAFLNLGVAYYGMGKKEKAGKSFRKAIEQNKFSIKTYLTLGAMYNENELYDEAIDILRKGIEIEVNSPDLYNSLGIVFDGKGQYDDAIDAYRRATSIDPLYIEVYNKLGIRYENKGLYREAVQAYKTVLGFTLDDAVLWNNIGYGYMKMESLENALFYFLKAVGLDRDLVAANYNLAGLYSLNNVPDLSIKYLKKAMDLGYNDYASIKTDKAFDNIRDSLHFTEAIRSYKR